MLGGDKGRFWGLVGVMFYLGERRGYLVKLIKLYTFAYMANILTIDLDKWTTQVDKAKERKCSIQYINKLIKEGKLQSLPLPIIGLVLVER